MDGIARLMMPGELRRQIFSHAIQSRPREAVGLLGGTPEGVVEQVIPLPNLAAGDKQFIADPFAQFRALQRLNSEHLQLLAIYHSHPAGGVEPSQEDLEYARKWSCAHLIIAFGAQGAARDSMRAFRCPNRDSLERVDVPVIPI